MASPAEKFITHVNKAYSQFHSVEEFARLLTANGFKKISEKSTTDWDNIVPNGKYFMTRNQSCLIAFSVGGKWKPGNGFVIQGAHTDSPVLKLKPISKITQHGCLEVGVQLYGGGLWHTWFDRDLSVAGRVLVEDEKGIVTSRLVAIKDPIVNIPNLAIHLNRDVGTKGFKFNFETELIPVLASQLKVNARLVRQGKAPLTGREEIQASYFEERHHSILIERVAAELEVDPKSIKDFELCLYDTQPAAITGVCKEFIAARGLDNQMMSFVCTEALIGASTPAFLGDATQIFMTSLFDNEEVGSASMQGAGSNVLFRTLVRINGNDTIDEAISRSILYSADMAHAVHPNYSSFHEALHRPLLHKGLVIKDNANQRYATNSVTVHHLATVAREMNIPTQAFCVRNDMGCGSTIGPILSSNTGIRTVDVGIPQWAMHSIRETCGVDDVASSLKLLTAIFPAFAQLDSKLMVDDEPTQTKKSSFYEF